MKGIFSEFPKVGEAFNIMGEGLEFGNRLIYTTPVAEILEEGTDNVDVEYIVFSTANSTYRVTKIEELEEDSNYLEETCKIPDSTAGVQ